jgi:solute carrier family 25 carnitine/acylcarnitine transporter 20/29
MATSRGPSAATLKASGLVTTLKDLFAGGLAGICSLIVCYPLDTMRTRLQTSTRFKGVVDCFVKTLKYEGVLAFYKGLSAPLAAQALQKAIMFGAYGAAQRLLQNGFLLTRNGESLESLSIPELFVCGMVAGLANTIVATPIELVRNRLMVQINHQPSLHHYYTGPIDCCRKILRERGIRGLWTGFAPTIARDGPGVGAYYAFFELGKRWLTPEGKSLSNTGFWTLMLAGAFAGVGYWVAAFPQDTIKSVMQTDHEGKYRNMWDCGKQLVKEGGVLRLYRGLPMGVVRGIPGAATTFTTFGLVSQMLQ